MSQIHSTKLTLNTVYKFWSPEMLWGGRRVTSWGLLSRRAECSMWACVRLRQITPAYESYATYIHIYICVCVYIYIFITPDYVSIRGIRIVYELMSAVKTRSMRWRHVGQVALTRSGSNNLLAQFRHRFLRNPTHRPKVSLLFKLFFRTDLRWKKK